MNFIKESCEGATEIKINMFLVSHISEGDIVDFLIEKSKKIKIILNIDHSQYINQHHIQETIEYIASKIKGNEGNFQIRRIKMKNPKSYFHDKLILIKKGDKKYVLIGSAGWTKDVQENNNYESMIQIKDDETYNYFDTHFKYFIPTSMNDKHISSKVEKIWKAQLAPSLNSIPKIVTMGGVLWAQEYSRK